MEFKQHLFPDEVALLFQWTVGICWMITYFLLIYKGYKEKSCGMPFTALCGNITWEFIYSFLFPHPAPQLYINYIWFGLDTIIFTQFILYSRSELPFPLSKYYFVPTLIASLMLAFSLHYMFALEFKDFIGVYSAFGLNMLMSLLFVMMLLHRNHLRGQSLYIAVFKGIGTTFASILGYAMFHGSIFLMLLFIATFFFDAFYVYLLYQRVRQS